MMKLFRKFWRNEAGTAPVEGVYGALLLLGWLIVSFQLYDAFRTRANALRASYTVGDLISRERDAIGPTYVAGLLRVFDYISQAPNRNYIWMRVTLLSCSSTATNKLPCDGVTKQFSLDNSYSTSPDVKAHTKTTINKEFERLPILSAGDSQVVVETSLRYYPLFKIGNLTLFFSPNNGTRIGLSDRLRFNNFVVTRPRGTRAVWDSTK